MGKSGNRNIYSNLHSCTPGILTTSSFSPSPSWPVQTFMKQGSNAGFCAMMSSFSLRLLACTTVQWSGACRLFTRAFTSLLKLLEMVLPLGPTPAAYLASQAGPGSAASSGEERPLDGAREVAREVSSRPRDSILQGEVQGTRRGSSVSNGPEAATSLLCLFSGRHGLWLGGCYHLASQVLRPQ